MKNGQIEKEIFLFINFIFWASLSLHWDFWAYIVR